MALLTNHEIAAKLSELGDWRIESGELRRAFTFSDFLQAINFVNLVAEIAERAGHHPDIDIRYNKVMISLMSHDAGGITDKDFAVAGEIGRIS